MPGGCPAPRPMGHLALPSAYKDCFERVGLTSGTGSRCWGMLGFGFEVLGCSAGLCTHPKKKTIFKPIRKLHQVLLVSEPLYRRCSGGHM